MNPANILSLFQKHRDKGLLLDSNLLLLYFVGCAGVELIPTHPRLSSYKQVDFELVAQIFHHFTKHGGVVTTPHILTEVTNLSDKLRGGHRMEFFGAIRHQINTLTEETIPARILAESPAFTQFGLTDTAISHLAARNLLVLTADRPLWGFLKKQKVAAIHYADLRLLCLEA